MYICRNCHETFCEPYIEQCYKFTDCPNAYGIQDKICPHCGSQDFTESSLCEACNNECLPDKPYLCDDCWRIALDVIKYAKSKHNCTAEKLTAIFATIEQYSEDGMLEHYMKMYS